MIVKVADIDQPTETMTTTTKHLFGFRNVTTYGYAQMDTNLNLPHQP